MIIDDRTPLATRSQSVSDTPETSTRATATETFHTATHSSVALSPWQYIPSLLAFIFGILSAVGVLSIIGSAAVLLTVF